MDLHQKPVGTLDAKWNISRSTLSFCCGKPAFTFKLPLQLCRIISLATHTKHHEQRFESGQKHGLLSGAWDTNLTAEPERRIYCSVEQWVRAALMDVFSGDTLTHSQVDTPVRKVSYKQKKKQAQTYPNVYKMSSLPLVVFSFFCFFYNIKLWLLMWLFWQKKKLMLK